MYVIGQPLLALVNIADTMLLIYSFVVLAVCVLSFVSADPSNNIVRIIHQLTDPVLAYIRKYVPTINGIDLSALALFVAIAFIRGGILPVIGRFASDLIG